MIATNLAKLARGVGGGAECARLRRASVSPLIGMASILAYLARTSAALGWLAARVGCR